MKSPRGTREGFHPEVRFGEDFARRLELFCPRLRAARERREGAGAARFSGAGEEFAGFRPYRPGEDLRQLDWNLLARLDRPFVRVTRREASERWAILIDGSASMGVGPPGKLQRAAELSCALGMLAVAQGASVGISVSADPEPLHFELRRRADMPGLLRFLEERVARGDPEFARLSSRARDAGRVFCIGDFLGEDVLDPTRFARRGREVFGLRLLAPVELAPGSAGLGGAVEWADPERGERLSMRIDRSARDAYDRALRVSLRRFDAACARHRIGFGTYDTAREFEDILTEALVR